jgi:tetratricopeptide (TPR) repeat protein
MARREREERPPAGASPWWRRLAEGALARPKLTAGLAAAAAYANTLPNRPVLDDGWAVVDNPLVRTFDLAGIIREQTGFAGGETLAGPYRPVATLSNAVSYALHGSAPAGYHAVNVTLHVMVTLLVLVLARRIIEAVAPGRATAGALGAALLFALHPVHVEAVAPLVARADMLAAAGGLSALLLALGRRERWWGLPAALALLALAILSKETAAVVPGLYALVALAAPAAAGLPAGPGLSRPEGRRALATLAGVTAALGLALLPYLLLRPGPAVAPGVASWFSGRPWTVVALTMTRALSEYLRLLAWPVDLMTDFGYAARIPFTERLGWPSALATLAWASVAAVGLASLRRAPLRAIGLLWAFIALAPVLNVVPVGVLMAERFLYLGSVGFCVWAGSWPAALAEAAARAGRPWPERGPSILALLVLALLAARTVTRNADWRDPVSLYEAELRHAPRDVTVNNNLAVAYLGRGELARAVERLDVALAAAPGYWRAHVNMGICRHRLGDLAGARAAFARASAISPGAASPRYFDALVLEDQGDLEGALAELGRAESGDRSDPRTPVEEARVLARLGRTEEARARLQRALALDPRSGEARRLLDALPPSR